MSVIFKIRMYNKSPYADGTKHIDNMGYSTVMDGTTVTDGIVNEITRHDKCDRTSVQ